MSVESSDKSSFIGAPRLPKIYTSLLKLI